MTAGGRPGSRARRLFVVAMAVVALAAILWGLIAQSRPVAERPALRATPVDAAWYAALPADATAATQVFIDRVPAAASARAEAFSRVSIGAIVLRVVVLLVVTALALRAGFATGVRDAAQRMTRHVVLQDALVAASFLVVVLAAGLPVEVFAGYIRYRTTGLSAATFPSWLGDYALQWTVDLVFYVVGIAAIMALIRRRPDTWPAYATLVYVALYATYVLLSPLYIEPLFNRFTQLADGPARDRILALARANNVPPDGVYVRDASRQSVMLNAHVSGIGGAARITLDDNTVASTPAAELQIVMAHEIGHYVLRHVFKQTVLLGLVMGAGFVSVAWAMRRLLAAHGRRWGIAGAGDPAAIPLFWLLVTLWGFVAMPVNNSIIREDEAEADLYGLNASQAPFGLADFMLRDADAHPLSASAFVEWALYTHPTPEHRIATAMRWRAEHLPR